MRDAPEASAPQAGSSALRRERLLAHVARLPTGPGVYLFRDERGAVAYVGKARNLRARVRSYFSARSGDNRRAVRFVERYVHSIECVLTETEPAAFLLESQLVKRHKPAYNVKLRDDKDFLYVRVDRRHAFPALGLARRPRVRTGAVSFHGPFAGAGSLRRTLRMLGGIIPLRDCTDREFASRTRPCLKHDMGRCSAPCVGLIAQPDYARLLEEALEVLAGRGESVLTRLETDMRAASSRHDYEQAARLRDQIAALRATTMPQQVQNTAVDEADVLGLQRAGSLCAVSVLFFRGGALVASTQHELDSELPDEELLAGFLLAFYSEGRPLPRELLLPVEPPDLSGLTELLAGRRGAPLRCAVPARGDRLRLVELATRNAEHALTLAVEQRGHGAALLAALAQRFGLPAPPETIECYDVSHTGRGGAVASRVVFRHGEPDRSRYRSYKLRTLTGPDDYAALAEVLTRRLAREATDPLPDLLLVDGGRGQLNAALAACRAAGHPDLALAALAKGSRRGRAVSLPAGERERIFLPGRAEPLELDGSAPEDYLLQRLRDEAHRVAIGAHRNQRSRDSLASPLDSIPGVGPVLRRRLLSAFGGQQGLARAGVDEIGRVRGVGSELAQRIREHLDAE